MSVIPLTIFFSLLLAGLFIGLFAFEQRRRRFASAERDSLLPLADERPRPVVRPASAGHAHRARGHADGEACGGGEGARPPGAGCPKDHSRSAPRSL